MGNVTSHKKRGIKLITQPVSPEIVGPELGARGWGLHPIARVRSPVAPLFLVTIIPLKGKSNEQIKIREARNGYCGSR